MSDTAPPAFSFPGCETVTDSKGRQLSVRRLTILEEMDLIEAAGGNADNRRWCAVASVAATVRAIDGRPEPFPKDRAFIRGLVKSLGNEGVDAVVEWLNKDAASGDAEPGEAPAAT